MQPKSEATRFAPLTTISHYAATMHEQPEKGNNLPYDVAVLYNEYKRNQNKHSAEPPIYIKTIEQMHTTSQGISAVRRRAGTKKPRR